MAKKISILRLKATGELISADAFETVFSQHLGRSMVISGETVADFTSRFPAHQSTDSAATRFTDDSVWRETVGNYDFFSPGFGAFLWAPLFLAQRNRAKLKTRLLFIAHAPIPLAFEWALCSPLLQPGDLLIAPSHHAARTMILLNQELEPWIRVIPHPIHPLLPGSRPPADTSPRPAGTSDLLVSLSRIHPDKLIHCQIEAFARLCRKKEFRRLQMKIAGPLHDAKGQELNYGRALRAQIRRLGLESRIELCGPLYEEREKAALLQQARALLNLSVSPEESFGKAIVEALGLGVPVVCTDWNGFRETLGPAGVYVPVTLDNRGRPGLDPETLSRALSRILRRPPSATACKSQAERSAPEKISACYREVLSEALACRDTAIRKNPRKSKEPVFASRGLLAGMAPLQIFSYNKVFDYYLEMLPHTPPEKAAGGTEKLPPGLPGAIIQNIILNAAGRHLSPFMAHKRQAGEILAALEQGPGTESDDTPSRDNPEANFFTRLAEGVHTPSCRYSQELSLLSCLNFLPPRDLRRALAKVTDQGWHSRAVRYLEIELRLLEAPTAALYELAAETFPEHRPPREDDLAGLRQLARIGRKTGCPEKPLPLLKRWLENFPDNPDAGLLWLDLCANAAAAGKPCRTIACKAFNQASELLGDQPALQKLACQIGVFD